MDKFEKLLIKNIQRKNINATYYLYIHLITQPQSPQIWRRIKINGRMTLEQFDEVLELVLDFKLDIIMNLDLILIHFWIKIMLN